MFQVKKFSLEREAIGMNVGNKIHETQRKHDKSKTKQSYVYIALFGGEVGEIYCAM